MTSSEDKIIRVLLSGGLLQPDQLQALQARQAQSGGRLQHLAVELGMCSEEQVARLLAEELGLMQIDLSALTPEPEALALLDQGYCLSAGILPYALRDRGRTLWIAVSDPFDLGLIEDVRARTGMIRVRPGISGPRAILGAIGRAYPGGGALPQNVDLGSQASMPALRPASRPPSAPPLGAAPSLPPVTVTRHRSVPPSAPPFAAPPAPAAAAPQAATGDSATERLQQVNEQIRESDRMLNAIIELCIRKGLFSFDTFNQRNDQ